VCRCFRLRSRLVHVSSGLHKASHNNLVNLMPPAEADEVEHCIDNVVLIIKQGG